MKNVLKIAGLSMLIAGLFFAGCKKTSDPDINLNSLMAGTIDLYGATQATDVPTDAVITATFSTNVDGASANSTNIKLMRGTTDVGINISASGSTITITPNNPLITGTLYSLSMTGVKSDKGKSLSDVSVGFLTVGVGLDTPPQASDQIMYLQLNGTVTDLTGNATDQFDQVAYTTDRYGNANGAAMFRGSTAPGNGDIVELSGGPFITPSSTYSVWFKVNAADYPQGTNRGMFGLGAERGIFMEMGNNLDWFKCATSHQVDPDPNNHYFGTAWTDVNGDGQTGGQVLQDYLGSVPDLLDGKWVQFVMTYDASTTIKTFYINGQVMRQDNLDLDATEWFLKNFAIADKADGTGDPVTGIDPVLALGFYDSRANTATGWAMYSTAENTFMGAMDDFRIWDKALTATEVGDLYNSEKP